jgi:hypothetical protein
MERSTTKVPTGVVHIAYLITKFLKMALSEELGGWQSFS